MMRNRENGKVTRFPPEHKGTIALKASTAGDRIFFAVQDSGIGIPADKLDHVFEVRNDGKETLQVISVKPGCGCMCVVDRDRP